MKSVASNESYYEGGKINIKINQDTGNKTEERIVVIEGKNERN